MTLRRHGIVCAFAFVLAALPVAGRSADPFEIPAILPLTGQLAFIGQSQAQTLQAVENEVNRTGGIQGRPLKFVITDDQSTPRVSVQLATLSMAKNGNVLLGPSFTANCNAVVPLVKEGPFEYCLSPGIHPTSGFSFSASVSTGDLVAAGIRYFRLRGWTRLAVIIATDASGQDVERGIRAALALPENKPMNVVAFEHFNPTDLSVAAQMSRIKENGPQVLITWGTGTPEGTLLRGVADAALDIPVFTSAANLTYAQMKTYGDFLPKQMLFPGSPVLALDQLPRGPVKSNVERFYNAFKGTGIRPDIGQAIAWDPAWIIVDALRKLGPNATAEQLRAYVADLHGWSGISGTYDFHAVPQRGLDIDQVVIVRWDKPKGTWVGVSKPGGAPL